MASLQSLKEKKFKQSIEIDYIDKNIKSKRYATYAYQKHMPHVHIAILFTSIVFTFDKLGHCPMVLQYYTSKTKLRKTRCMHCIVISDSIDYILRASNLLLKLGHCPMTYHC